MDLTSLWVFIQRNKKHVGTLIFGALLFVAGWQLGKVTSPYYAAHPIVFEDRQCDQCSSSGGTPEELTQLKEAGIAEREPDTQQAAKPTAPPSSALPAVAGSATTDQAQFVASKNSNLFHDPSCSSVGRIKETNKIWFANQAEAAAAGYTPSKCTQKLLGL